MPLSSIELRRLRYFLAAAEHGSFRKAAAALAVEESAISRRVRDLEDRLGASLFQRHHSGVVLTVAGQQFLDQVRAAVSHLGYGAKNVALAGRSEVGHIRVGILSSLSSGFLADLFLAFGSDQSAVSIDFTDGNTIKHVAAIRAHHIDIAFVTGTGRPPECEAVYLWSEPVFALLRAGPPLSSKPFLTWEHLIDETIIVSEQIPGHESHASVL